MRGPVEQYHRDLTTWVNDEIYKASIRSMRNLLVEMRKLAEEIPHLSATELIDHISPALVPVPEEAAEFPRWPL